MVCFFPDRVPRRVSEERMRIRWVFLTAFTATQLPFVAPVSGGCAVAVGMFGIGGAASVTIVIFPVSAAFSSLRLHPSFCSISFRVLCVL